MKHAAMVAMMLFAVSVNAGDLFVKDRAGSKITLKETACSIAGWFSKWKNAIVLYQGKTYQACWRLQADSVVVIDSAGDVTPVPAGAFQRETES